METVKRESLWNDVETGRNFTFKGRKKIDSDARDTCIRIEISQVAVNVKQTAKLVLKMCTRATSFLGKHFFQFSFYSSFYSSSRFTIFLF